MTGPLSKRMTIDALAVNVMRSKAVRTVVKTGKSETRATDARAKPSRAAWPTRQGKLRDAGTRPGRRSSARGCDGRDLT
jgi:hypothetical protein